jgi:excisionase family DNA binding protein
MQNDEFLRLDEVMRLTRAASLSVVRHWLRTGKLASVRPGRLRLVRRADLVEFLNRGALPGPPTPEADPRQRGLPFTTEKDVGDRGTGHGA